MEAPVILKGGPIARTKKGNDKFIKGGCKKRSKQKLQGKGGPIGKTQKKVNKKFIQGGP